MLKEVLIQFIKSQLLTMNGMQLKLMGNGV